MSQSPKDGFLQPKGQVIRNAREMRSPATVCYGTENERTRFPELWCKRRTLKNVSLIACAVSDYACAECREVR